MKKEYKALGTFGTLGLEIALSVLFGAYGGYWLDGKAHTAPALLIVGFLFGCGAAGKAIHRSLQEMKRESAREEKEQGNPAPIFDETLEKGSVRAADEQRTKVKVDRERP
ncbi:MAG: AtpZ/AtpI family protein [Minicystis sp.]